MQIHIIVTVEQTVLVFIQKLHIAFYRLTTVCYKYAIFIDERDGNATSAIDRETETSGDTLEGQEHRVIFINRPQPPVIKYCNNRISTAKYRYVYHTFCRLYA